MRSVEMLTSMLVRVAASVNALSVCVSEGSTAFNCDAVAIDTIFSVAFFRPFVATTNRFRSFPRIAGVSSSHSISSSSLDESFGGGGGGGNGGGGDGGAGGGIDGGGG